MSCLIKWNGTPTEGAIAEGPLRYFCADKNGKPAASEEETRISFDDFVVISVAAYPEPQQAIRYLNGQCPIMHPYTD